MTQEEILEYNKRCAEFLNLHRNEEVAIYNMKEYPYDFLKFHSDWNWIMEVLKQITKYGYNWELIDFNGTVTEEKFMKCSIFNLELGKPYNKFTTESSDEKEAVVQAINKFLILHE